MELADRLETVMTYHDETKHQFNRYAPGPGYLDWATQPNPFRSYEGAAVIELEVLEPVEGSGGGQEPRYEQAFRVGQIAAATLNRRSLSQLLYDSMALSAWVQYGEQAVSKRVNPSSGNLHPTEAYVICGAVEGLTDGPMVTHYAPKKHVLEKRTAFSQESWTRLTAHLPNGAVLIGLSSIFWRESWKYGERAYRYCHHDIGHAIAAIAVAASGLGWQVKLVDHPDAEQLGNLLGLFDSQGPEQEHPDCLLVVFPAGETVGSCQVDATVMEEFRHLEWQGTPNVLSPDHREWGRITTVAQAAKKPVTDRVYEQGTSGAEGVPAVQTETDGGSDREVGGAEGIPAVQAETDGGRDREVGGAEVVPDADMGGERELSLRKIIRQRRSAIDMDGMSTMTAEAFYGMLARTLAGQEQVPFSTLPWEPHVHVALFVHRVDGLEPGLYMLVRNQAHMEALQAQMRQEYVWQQPESCPDEVPLYLLVQGDFQAISRQVSCDQTIASHGCFSVGMIADFERPLAQYGTWFYPRLYWECGMIGQVLYLEAEAAGLRGTGIGCYYDDPMHRILGLKGKAFQDLYHFTIGGSVEDSRLTTTAAY